MTLDVQTRDQGGTELLKGYKPAPGAFDELIGPDGAPRAQWKALLDALRRVPPRDRIARASRLERQVRETGLVHDAFADPEKLQQQWRLNLMPLVIAPDEWLWLERAIIQRARLFNSILADIYGSQRLLSSGKIPPAIVFADPAYLRACQGIVPIGGHLQFFAADLARGPDGRWRVIDSHTETPAGVGYAVANRVMHTDVADDIFLECRARRIAAHFNGLQTALAERSARSDPTVALLTPGPDHADYFSHAYLARYLDLSLVEGGDLRVVGDEVFLKTLEGLKKVDLLIRCVEGAKADPLELDPASFLGPSGLVHACRRSPGLSINALGSALIQNRALGAHLPALCVELLGEDLLLDDASRHWLGDEAARQSVGAAPDEFVIRPASEGTGRPGQAALGRVAGALSGGDRDRLLAEMRSRGEGLVAERRAGFGTMPSLTAQGLRPRPFGLRLFASATKDGFDVMPGGLAMGVDAATAVALSTSDGENHDVWILASEPERPHTSLWRPRVQAALVQRSQRMLQSRVADNLFWLGRYLERADWTMRVVRSSLGRRLEYIESAPTRHAGDICIEMLLAKGGAQLLPAGSRRAGGRSALLASQLISERESTYSLVNAFDAIYRIANLTRDRLSLEAWRTLSSFRVDEAWRRRMAEAGASELQDEVEDKLSLVATFSGHLHENMTRNFGWFFLDMGRRLERAFNLCDTLGLLFRRAEEDDETNVRLNFILRLADSYITYRSRYRLQPMLPLVLDLLVMDETNPRSVAYQVAGLMRHLEALPQQAAGNALSRERRIVLSLQTAIRLADVSELAAASADGTRPQLGALLKQAVDELPHLSEAISRRYFRLVDDEPHRVVLRHEP